MPVIFTESEQEQFKIKRFNQAGELLSIHEIECCASQTILSEEMKPIIEVVSRPHYTRFRDLIDYSSDILMYEKE